MGIYKAVIMLFAFYKPRYNYTAVMGLVVLSPLGRLQRQAKMDE